MTGMKICLKGESKNKPLRKMKTAGKILIFLYTELYVFGLAMSWFKSGGFFGIAAGIVCLLLCTLLVYCTVLYWNTFD